MADNDLAVRPATSREAADTSRKVVETSATAIDTSTIVGWGVDADPENDPTYPIRDRSNDDHSGQWQRPTQQRPDVELLQSIEHKQLPAVFGTSSPPKWISGWMRRLAFRWSESNWAHWLILLGADRVNMVEGLVEDLARGKVPNIPKEWGARSNEAHKTGGQESRRCRGHRRRHLRFGELASRVKYERVLTAGPHSLVSALEAVTLPKRGKLQGGFEGGQASPADPCSAFSSSGAGAPSNAITAATRERRARS